ncbi:uncharacterized protein LOC135500680 [Lineus longissimus]|uniref:uncharacterized protein LOC135500680 n=1 Tax=Lineus longissimus TaxID=88925 RepID=UPI00315D8C9E
MIAAKTSCLNMGTVGVAVNGVALFSPFDLEGDNAVEGPGAETFDSCDGHPTGNGLYHYHQLPDCLSDNTPGQLIGVALDGFPIYGPVDADGNDVTSADLDGCNGRYVGGEYRYHVTRTFPYIMGCYSGTPPPAGNRRCDFALNTPVPGADAMTTQPADKDDSTAETADKTTAPYQPGPEPTWTNAAGPGAQLGVWVLIATLLLTICIEFR